MQTNTFVEKIHHGRKPLASMKCFDLHGRKRYADEMKQCREEESEIIALNMLKAQYHLEQIAKLTGLDTKHILKLAKNNNLLDT